MKKSKMIVRMLDDQFRLEEVVQGTEAAYVSETRRTRELASLLNARNESNRKLIAWIETATELYPEIETTVADRQEQQRLERIERQAQEDIEFEAEQARIEAAEQAEADEALRRLKESLGASPETNEGEQDPEEEFPTAKEVPDGDLSWQQPIEEGDNAERPSSTEV